MPSSAHCSILTLNVEGHKHFKRVRALLRLLKPDVVCLQEVFKVDLLLLKAALGGAEVHFAPMMSIDRQNVFGLAPLGEFGLAILSRLPSTPAQVEWYFGNSAVLPTFNDQDPNTPNRLVMWLDVQASDQWLRVATTHFTWSPEASYTSLQGETLEKLQRIYTQKIKHGVLCGDFNAPRGGEIYRRLTQTFADHIPAEVKTTLDPDLHRAGDLQLVVDYLFTAGPYAVTDIQVHSSVSDHLGISGNITRL